MSPMKAIVAMLFVSMVCVHAIDDVSHIYQQRLARLRRVFRTVEHTPPGSCAPSAVKTDKLVNKVKLYMLASFDAWDQTVFDKFMDLISLNTDKITKDQAFVAAKAEFATPRAFVDKVFECGLQNPILQMFAQYVEGQLAAKKPFDLIPSKIGPEARKTVIKDAIHYCYVLNCLVKGIHDSPIGKNTLLNSIENVLKTLRNKPEFQAGVNGAFEVAKLVSIMVPVVGDSGSSWRSLQRVGAKLLGKMDAKKTFLSYKLGKDKVGDRFGGPGLTLNIFEAMVQDVKKNHKPNAFAGYRMMMRPAGMDPIPALGNLASVNDDKGNVKVYPPLPKFWSDLYNSWNLAFVSNYGNWPYFFGKLLNPHTLCYKDHPETYLGARVIALYLHIHYEMAQRAQSLQTSLDWVNAPAVEEWGKVNLQMADCMEDEIKKKLKAAKLKASDGKLNAAKHFSRIFKGATAIKKKWQSFFNSKPEEATIDDTVFETTKEMAAEALALSQLEASSSDRIQALDLMGVPSKPKTKGKSPMVKSKSARSLGSS